MEDSARMFINSSRDGYCVCVPNYFVLSYNLLLARVIARARELVEKLVYGIITRSRERSGGRFAPKPIQGKKR